MRFLCGRGAASELERRPSIGAADSDLERLFLVTSISQTQNRRAPGSDSSGQLVTKRCSPRYLSPTPSNPTSNARQSLRGGCRKPGPNHPFDGEPTVFMTRTQRLSGWRRRPFRRTRMRTTTALRGSRIRAMDWVVDTSDSDKMRALRGDVVGYLRRHAVDSTGLDDCELAVSELITNVARHASGPVWVTVEWPGVHPSIRVADVGPGFDLSVELPPTDSIGGRGLFIVNSIVTKLEASRRDSGGSVVTAILPVARTPTVSIDPPRRRTAELPSLDEAEEGRGIGREAFLRALVVQLAHTVSEQTGPDAAERAVAQVGTDVGGQMELEYRTASGALGRLSSQQLAECFVRLKQRSTAGSRSWRSPPRPSCWRTSAARSGM